MHAGIRPTLRPYQAKLKADTYAAWAEGARVVMAVAPTGAGKTVLFSDVLQEHNGASCAIAHRQELVSQISLALARNGVRHRIIGQDKTRKLCQRLHLRKLGRHFVDANARCAVAGIRTLVGIKPTDPEHAWLAQVSLWIGDEGHHFLKENEWGRGVAMFSNPSVRGLLVTATPRRADGRGLGSWNDGLADVMVLAPSMRDLINMGYLTDYQVYAPPCNIDWAKVPVGASGEFVQSALAEATKGADMVGDVVDQYLKIAPGKLGITFAVDVEEAGKIALRFRERGVPAEVVHAKTPDEVRADVLARFERREVLQLVNVDLFGEGFDLPAIEVVSMARGTNSWSLFCLDPETEVLTPDGWKNHEGIASASEVIGFDVRTGATRAVKIEGRVKRPMYDREVMYRIDAPHLDIAVSDKHDLLVKGRSSTCKNWQKQTAETVAARASLFRVPVAGRGVFAGANLSDADLRLLGWFLSDGYANKSTNSMQICQSSRKPAHVAAIRQAIIDCGFKYGECVNNREGCPDSHAPLTVFSVSRGAPRGRDKHLTGWGRLGEWVDKSIPACYDSLTREQLLVLLETLNLGDGANELRSRDYVTNTLSIACGTNKRMADRLQALCVTRGLRCNIARAQYDGRGEWWTLHIRDSDTATVAGRNVPDGSILGKSYARSRLTESDYRPPFVWCVSNELGTLITRRNGKVTIMGNCQQWGRALRLMVAPEQAAHWDRYDDAARRSLISLSSKPTAIIIDHVGNVLRHNGPPDKVQQFSLERREKRSSGPSDAIPYRVCSKCTLPFPRTSLACPRCGHVPAVALRSAPVHVDGDLHLLDADALAFLRGEVDRIDGEADARGHDMIAFAIRKRHVARQEAQAALRQAMQWYGGYLRDVQGVSGQGEAWRHFFFKFGTDVASAQALGATEANQLRERVAAELARAGVAIPT